MTTLLAKSTRAVGRANLANVRPVTIAVAKTPVIASNVTSTWPKRVAGAKVP